MFSILTIVLVLQLASLTISQHLTQIIQLPHLNLTEETSLHSPLQLTDFKTLNHDLTTIHRLQLIAAKSFQHSSDDITAMFYLNNTAFTLNTNRTFDRERLILNNQCDQSSQRGQCLLKLKIAAYDNTQTLVKIFIQPIEVNDINDNNPQFRKPVYEVNISENLVQTIPIESPIDTDSPSNSIQACSVAEYTNLFNAFYNRFTSRLFLKVISALDRESTAKYVLTLNCSDGREFTTAQLNVNVLDANDNAPVFKQASYSADVDENFGQNIDGNETVVYKRLVQVSALDKDTGLNAKLVYSLPVELNFDYGDLFRIEPATGWIEVDQQGLDFEKAASYVLKVKVTDMGSNPVPSYTDVSIQVNDLNDNSPKAHITYDLKHLVREEKLNSTIWINEELSNGTVIAYLSVSDLDTAATNGHKLSAALTSVTCMDTRTGAVKVRNELFKLVAIVQEYENLYFGLQVDGRIDREEFGFFDLVFELSDNAASRLVSKLPLRIVLNDINDNAPTTDAAYLNLSIRENTEALRLARLQVRDADLSQEFTYSIQETLDEGFLFGVDESGWLQVKHSIDRETRDKFRMVVRCMDEGGLFTDVYVTLTVLDENDNMPVFEARQLNFSLPENVPVGSVIGSLRVHDSDLSPSTGFLIEPAELASYFQVNNSTGELTTAAGLDAEAFNFTVARLEITAIDLEMIDVDKARFNKVIVNVRIVDLNDNAPRVSGLAEFTVFNMFNRSSSADSVLASFNSSDADRDVQADQIRIQMISMVYVQRYTWQFVLEVMKSAYANRTDLVQFVSDIIERQKELEIKPVLSVDLKNVFVLKTQPFADMPLLRTDLLLQKPHLLNWGVYNFTLDLTDTSTGHNQPLADQPANSTTYLTSRIATKIFVLNQAGLNESLLAEVDRLLNAWFLNSFIELKYSNGDEMELLEQEYLKFYAARALDKANRLKEFFFANSSLAIIGLVSFFSLIAVLLIIVITYKHYKVGKSKASRAGQSGSSSTSLSEGSSAITTLADVKKLPVHLMDTENFFSRSRSPSSAFFEASTQRRNYSYPPPSLRAQSRHVNMVAEDGKEEEKGCVVDGCDSSVNSLEIKAPDSKESINTATTDSACGDSFTVITSLTSSALVTNKTHQPRVKHMPKLKNLSTFAPYSTPHVQTDELASIKINDLGYYGSSDYSDNSATKQVKLQHRQKYVYNNIAGKQAGANSTSSFTSSVMSSPTASSSSSGSNSNQSPVVQRQPLVTNLYPYTNQLNDYLVTEVNDTCGSRGEETRKDLNSYLERFERIYNSDECNSTFNGSISNARLAKEQRNNTYSYV